MVTQIGDSGASLGDLISALADLEEDHTIFAERPWSRTSAAVVADEEEWDGNEALPYFLEVWAASDVVRVWEDWHNRKATVEDTLRAVLFYAANDAYLDESDVQDPAGQPSE